MRLTKPSGLVLAVGVAFAAACDSGSRQGATGASPTPTTIAGKPAVTLPLDSRLVKTFTIQTPGQMVVQGEAVWVKTDDGRLVQLDTAANKIAGEVKLDTAQDASRYCQGLGAGDKSIWACSANDQAIDVVRIDPTTRKVVARIEVAKIFDQLSMPYLANRIWVISGDADRLVGIDVATNKPSSSIDLGAQCSQLAATSDALVTTCSQANKVLKVDPATGKIIGQVALEGPGIVAATADTIWVGTETGVARLNAGDLSLAAVFDGISPHSAGDLYPAEGSVWVRVAGPFLYEIDPRSNTVARQITADPQVSGGGVVATADSVWVTASDDDLVYRLNR
jgi:glutamine cyclotransferase